MFVRVTQTGPLTEAANTMGKKRSLHVMVDAETYEKLRMVCFYEHMTLAEIIRRLLNEFLEEWAMEEKDICAPRRL